MELRFPLIINICRLLFNGERTISSDDLHTGFYLFMQKYLSQILADMRSGNERSFTRRP
jgi:hypothetical protein